MKKKGNKKEEEEAEEEKADNLEIVSIGVLYEGSWDKKYWSCSRGKDRYPYPVGYQSIRAHNGSTYKMEIREGLKGPLFVITSADGQSCSGQTADIAWERFQKQGFPRVRLLHGKRFLCKIDGVEFFGFRNSFVQRLLRELVADVNGTAKQSLPSSSFCNGASGKEHDTESSDRCRYPDLQQYLARSRVTGKRSRKHKIMNVKSIIGVHLKKSRSEDLTCNGEDLHVRQGNQRDDTDMNFKTFSKTKEKNGIRNHPGDSSVSENLQTVAVEEKSSFSSHVIFPNKKLSKENSLNRSRGCVMPEVSFSMATEEPQLKNAPKIIDEDLCAPDTLDDDTSDPVPTSSKEKPCYVEDELISGHVVDSEGSAPESHPEEEMATSTSNESYEKSDFDSVGQEIAKSMMTVLLPQALPLLKKSTKKKTANINTLESGHVMVVMPSARIHVESSHVEREGRMHILSGDPSAVVRSFKHVNSVIHDSPKNDQCEKHVDNHVHYDLEADQATNKDISAPDSMSLLVSDDTRKASSICHVSTGRNNGNYYPPHMPPDDRSQKGDILISESVLSCTSPRKEAFFDKSRYASANEHGNSSCLETYSEEKACRTTPDYIEDTVDARLTDTEISLPLSHKEINSKREGCVIGNIVSIGGEDVASLTKIFGCPLSESIICRNFEEDCAPEGYHASGALESENFQVISSDKISNEKVPNGVEPNLKIKPYSLHTEKCTLNAEGVCFNMVPVKSHNQALDFMTKDKNTSEFPEPPVLIDTCHSSMSIDKELIRHSNLVQFNNSKSWLKKQAEEAQAGSDLKPHMIEGSNSELGKFVELVGCYVHPTPISSVLSTITENEIYICVLCGPLGDKDRTLFMYKLPIKEPRGGRPSFIGHASITLPFSREMSVDRSGLQFTPDGQGLVLLNSIRAPNCREGKVHCPCSACTSDCFEENAVKIVQLKLGYVSLVARMKTVNCALSILVCRPNLLVAVEEGGRLHVWVMNSAWSAQTEEFVIPTSDCISPCVEELKQIPKCAHLVIGHNGYGEFGLWDISKRILISRFSVPSKSVIRFLPISLFGWKRKDPISSNSSVNEHLNKIMAATKVSISDHSDKNAYLTSKEQEMGIWLLVSTVPDSDVQYSYESNCQMNPVGWWRLALLVENVVILGSVLDRSVSAIGTSAGHGIIATSDGQVYMWELSTGTKLGTLHYFKDGGVSCIATDDSRLGVLAVAGNAGQLLVYLHHQIDSED